jgi:sensor histidine kinase regulating citrate/malate metabolism
MHSDLVGLVIPATDISSILGNLLENAFDAVGTVAETEHRVVSVSFAEDQHHFIISVLNKRPLIPKEIQSKIFQKGFSTKGMSGSGLGLAIVKELTEKHGGSVQLVSDAETGTLFTLRFPKAYDNLPA